MSGGESGGSTVRQVPVLDFGLVRLVDWMGGDGRVVDAARVSYRSESKGEAQDAKLLSYLWRNRHTSPFEHVNLTFYVKAPIFVLRQWHRHRTWSYNEVSARYTELPEEFFLPEVEDITQQSEDNKQMRGTEQVPSAGLCRRWMERINRDAHTVYQDLLNEGCPRELARTVLPLATYTEMFASVDLLNLFRFLELRLHEHAQTEIRVYAEAILELIEPLFPVCVEGFKDGLTP